MYFVTGTDTGVGKTLVSAALTLGLGAHYWKPIQSGLQPQTDTEWVRQKTGLDRAHFFPEAYKLKEPLSPHAAASLDGVEILLDKISLPSSAPIVVEGAGGVLVPLNGEEMMIDLIQKLSLPTIVVARSGLGTLNHTLMTLSHLRERGIPILGVVLNGEKNPSNYQAIEKYGKVPILGEIEPMESVDEKGLVQVFNSLAIQ